MPDRDWDREKKSFRHFICKKTFRSGFTLIELSIVLVIIGLIVGGVLTGRDLIKSAEARATITQMERYNTAANTFRDKYGGLPGDLPVNLATQFGFMVGGGCSGIQGARDGNGLIEGWNGGVLQVQGQGETELFWTDLSTAKLIQEQFPNGGAANPSCFGGSTPIFSSATIGQYLPAGKIGYNTQIYVYSSNGVNYFGLSSITATTGPGSVTSVVTIPVSQAYSLDKKIDDGLPTSGRVQAVFLNGYSVIVNASNAATPSAATCYDTTSYTYSINQNNGNGANCALSFIMQAGD